MNYISKFASFGWKLLTRLLDGLPYGSLVEPLNKISTSYLSSIFYPDRFKQSVPACIEEAKLLKEELGFDSIAFTGTSGAAMGFILGHALNVPLICVRKEKDNSHYVNNERFVEGNIGTRKYLIVDDFISTGKTVNYIMDSIKQEAPDAKCVGMMMYGTMSDNYNYHRYDGTSFIAEYPVFMARMSRKGQVQY